MAQFDTVVTEGELPPQPKQERKKHSVLSILFRILWITVFVVAIAASTQIIYDYTRYDNFWVSGDSMYPTLNKDATSNRYPGKTNDGTWGNFTGRGDMDEVNYVCDYGLSDFKEGFQDNLKRFDIVVAHYDSTYNPYTGLFSEDAVIKRLIGLPGESLYFDLDGTLHVKMVGSSEYVVVDQPSLIVNDVDAAGNRTISQTASASTIGGITGSQGPTAFYGSPEHHADIGENEYYVLGDNRRKGASDDSRKYGPLGIKRRTDSRYPTGRDLISGEAIAITGKRKVVFKIGVSDPSTSMVLGSTLMPWAVRYLGSDGEGATTAAIASSSSSLAAWRETWLR